MLKKLYTSGIGHGADHCQDDEFDQNSGIWLNLSIKRWVNAKTWFR